MADRWIVSDYKFYQHKSLEGAEAEKKRLSELLPSKQFRIYRIKLSLNRSASKQIISDQAAELEALRGALHGVIGYALTAKSESTAWLQGMADKINEAATALCDTDRAVVCGESLRIQRLGGGKAAS